MNEKEVEQIERAERPDVEFIRLWTKKEAMLKLTGEGLTNDLKSVLTGNEQIETTVNMEKNYVWSVVFA
jgi:4'-phosphopantetheinyl transferase